MDIQKETLERFSTKLQSIKKTFSDNQKLKYLKDKDFDVACVEYTVDEMLDIIEQISKGVYIEPSLSYCKI